MDKSTGGRGTAVLFKAAGEPLASDLYYQVLLSSVVVTGYT
jgi:hypothetical protein